MAGHKHSQEIEKLRGMLHKDVEGNNSESVQVSNRNNNQARGVAGLTQLSEVAGRFGGQYNTGSQEGPLVETNQSLQQAAPSQPELPLPGAHQESQVPYPTLHGEPYFTSPTEMQQLMMQQQNMYFALSQPEETSQPGKRGPRKATRRGPMDEMRQLIRILVKIFPQSACFIDTGDESGGGNRISEMQIKSYLSATLGKAPFPTWGVPEGWGEYLASLFRWGTDLPITAEDALKCAKREPGRSWEAVETQLLALGVHPHCWPLPLTKAGISDAQRNPVPQPIPKNGLKRGGQDAGGVAVPGSKRQKSVDRDLKRMNELELWEHMGDLCHIIASRSGTYHDQQAVQNAKDLVRSKLPGILEDFSMAVMSQLPFIDPNMFQMIQNMATTPAGDGSSHAAQGAEDTSGRGKAQDARGAFFGALESGGDAAAMSPGLPYSFYANLMPHMMLPGQAPSFLQQQNGPMGNHENLSQPAPKD